jgi:hypothetical protein
MWKKLLTSPFIVVENRFYPEEEEQRGRLRKQQGSQQSTCSLRTPVTRDCCALCVFLRWSREGPPGSWGPRTDGTNPASAAAVWHAPEMLVMQTANLQRAPQISDSGLLVSCYRLCVHCNFFFYFCLSHCFFFMAISMYANEHLTWNLWRNPV